MRAELGESLDHLRLAAAHAAGGTADAVAPRWGVMRNRVEQPIDKSMSKLVDTAADSARQAKQLARRATGRKQTEAKRRRWPMTFGGLMVAGAVAGAAGALMSRRRRQKWDEYGSDRMSSTIKDEARSIVDSTQSTVDKTTDKIKSTADRADDKANEVLGQLADSTETATTSGPGTTGTAGTTGASTAGTAGTAGTTGTASRTTDQFSPTGSGTPGSRNSRP